jgi:hypothetical protein
MAFAKADKGILMLENLTEMTRKGGPLHSVDKREIVDANVAKVALKALAKFHGIWLCWLKAHDPKDIAGLNNEAIQLMLDSNIPKSALKDWLKPIK